MKMNFAIVLVVLSATCSIEVSAWKSRPKSTSPTESCTTLNRFQTVDVDRYEATPWINVQSKLYDADDSQKSCVAFTTTRDNTTPAKKGEIRLTVRVTLLIDNKPMAFDLMDIFENSVQGSRFIHIDDPDYPLYILDTNYDSYSIEYSCNKDNKPEIYVLSRTPTLSIKDMRSVRHALKRYQLDNNQLRNVNQTNCPIIN